MLDKFAQLMRRVASQSNGGDTIVEVLIAIAVAAFAIGTSYAIANRSLQEAITARERNESTNVIQSQLTALKLRYIDNKTIFFDNTKGYVVRSTTPTPPDSALPFTDYHFCLDAQSASPDDTVHPWARIVNSRFTSDKDADNISSGNKYAPGCIVDGASTQYFIDISAQITKTSKNSKNRTVYKVAVRWAQVGSSTTAESVVYYRL